MNYYLGYWDANDGKGCREHILTSKDFEERGVCEYLGDIYVESEMDEYIEKYGENIVKENKKEAAEAAGNK